MAASWTHSWCDSRLTRSSSLRDAPIPDIWITSWQHVNLRSPCHPTLETKKRKEHAQLRVPVSTGKNIESIRRANANAFGQGRRPVTEKQLDMDSGPTPPNDVHLQSFRAKVRLPPANSKLPRLDALIIVEGYNDCAAVHRAVRAPVFVLGGGYALAESMKPELQYLSLLATTDQLPRQLVVFTDPDWQGRMFRTYLDDFLSQPQSAASLAGNTVARHQGDTAKPGLLVPSGKPDNRLLTVSSWQAQAQGQAQDVAAGEGLVVRHAFLRVELGTSDQASKNHEAGNVGVEHASPETIRVCLKRARRGFGSARKEFSLEELQAEGLVGSWDDKRKVAGPQISRGRFCRALGLDEVGTGKALLNLLNRFFTREDFAAALQAARIAVSGGDCK